MRRWERISQSVFVEYLVGFGEGELISQLGLSFDSRRLHEPANRRKVNPDHCQQAADRSDEKRGVNADHLAQRPTDQRPQWNRTPYEKAHTGVHPSLQTQWDDGLPQTHLRDVIDRDRPAADEQTKREHGAAKAIGP